MAAFIKTLNKISKYVFMKNLSIISLVICSFAFILDIIDAVQAALNHNIQSLVFFYF